MLGAMATGPGALGAFMFAVPAGLIGGAVGAGINAWRGWSASKEAEPGVATRLETAFHYGVSGATLTGAAVGTAVLGALATGPGALGAFFFAVPAALIGGTAAGLANAWRGWRAGG